MLKMWDMLKVWSMLGTEMWRVGVQADVTSVCCMVRALGVLGMIVMTEIKDLSLSLSTITIHHHHYPLETTTTTTHHHYPPPLQLSTSITY